MMEMNYRHMVDQARKAGVTNEKTMWESIDSFSELLEELEHSHPELYWEFIRKQHGIMYHGHYDEAFAMYDVSQIKYTNKSGEKKQGAYWTVDQIESATAGMKFSPGVNKYDKYVGFNLIASDLCKEMDESSILKAAYLFFFADEDWEGDDKVWTYVSCKMYK